LPLSLPLQIPGNPWTNLSKVKKRFSILLPLLNLTIWVVLVIVPTTLAYISLLQMAHSSSTAEMRSGEISASIPRERFASFALSVGTIRQSHLITAINMPGMVSDLLVSIPIWHINRLRTKMTMESWRALTFPLFCLPAWWFVGKGVDALVGTIRLHWITLLLGCLFCALLIFLGVGLGLTADADDRADTWWILSGMGLWAVLFAVFPFAWLRQKRSSVTA
jgi:hypothetical protein